MNFEEAKSRLDQINSVIKLYDEALKQRACDILIELEFADHSTPEATLSNADSVPQVGEETTFDALVEKWSPNTVRDRALLAAYFVQTIQKQDAISAQTVNTILKHHGIGVANITEAINANIESQPALMIQLRKSGTTKQARKLYKVTTAGVKFVNGQLQGLG